MNAIPAVVAPPVLRRRSRTDHPRPVASATVAPRPALRTRRLAAALAAVLALGGFAGSVQAADDASQGATTSSEAAWWDAVEQVWAQWFDDEQAAALSDDEGGSVDPETGDPKRNP